MEDLSLSFDLIPDTNYDRLSRALPVGYKAEEFGHQPDQPESFAIFIGSKQIAIATVKGKGFVFSFDGSEYSAGYFKAALIRTYPKADPDRLLWLAVYPEGNCYTYFGAPLNNSGLVLKNLVPSVFCKPGAYIVAFKATEWNGSLAIKVDQSYPITGTGVNDFDTGRDEGEKMFLFTNLE